MRGVPATGISSACRRTSRPGATRNSRFWSRRSTAGWAPRRITVYEILGLDHPSSRDWSRCDDEWDTIAAMMEDWLGRQTFREEYRAAE